jgi:transcriptional regulator with XRE-family HTH domain
MTMSRLQRWVSHSPERARIYAQESLIIDVSEEIQAAMDKAGCSKSDLATKLGSSKSHVTQLLSGGRNLTLRTLADIASALGRKPCFRLMNADETWLDVVVSTRPPLKPIGAEFAPQAINDAQWLDLERQAA